jgi:hypothetical protein
MQSLSAHNSELLKQLRDSGVDVGDLEAPAKTDCIELQRIARFSQD